VAVDREPPLPPEADERPGIALTSWIRATARLLADAGIPNPRSEARCLASHVLGLPLSRLLADVDRVLAPGEQGELDRLAALRARRIPLQHLTGSTGFMGLEIDVSPGVLVPRPDTETLVEAALDFLAARAASRPGLLRFLDIGTGTGCVAAALSFHLRQRGIRHEALASDTSPEALALAARNLARLDLAETVRLVHADLFPPETLALDLVVSNPPYIPTPALDGLMPEVALHDPRSALDGGPDGLDILRRIVALAPDRLLPGGALMLEHGAEQAPSVASLLEDQPGFGSARMIRDAGGLPRITLALRGKEIP